MAASNRKDHKSLDNGPGEGDRFLLEGYQEVDSYAALGGKCYEKAVKDTPCKFHDGFSGTCWKGTSCPYSHALYSGGKFAEKYPELALATSLRQVATSVHRLPEKVGLNEERQFKGRVTHIVSPGEFFIRPLEEGAPCLCSKVDDLLEQARQHDTYAKPDMPMDPYYYGHTAMMNPPQEGAAGVAPAEKKAMKTEDELHSFLSQAYNYTRFQNLGGMYISKVELVAALVNKKWKRAVILNQLEDVDPASTIKPRMYVQLLDTGEKLLVSMKEVCRLPEKFAAKPTSAYRCMLWGCHPFFFHWAKTPIKVFKEMVEDRDLTVIIKTSCGDSSTQTFERKPYMVELKIRREPGSGDDAWMDIGKEMCAMGMCLPWNMLPKRPFAVDCLDTDSLDAVTDSKPTDLPVSDTAVAIENARLLLDGQSLDLNDSIDSGTQTVEVVEEESEGSK